LGYVVLVGLAADADGISPRVFGTTTAEEEGASDAVDVVVVVVAAADSDFALPPLGGSYTFFPLRVGDRQYRTTNGQQ
jgi:hypothetical protein